MKLAVEQVKDCSEDDFIGGDWTHLALKNHNSYLIGTDKRGFKIIEDDKKIYSANFDRETSSFLQVIYIPPPLNCYLMASETRI